MTNNPDFDNISSVRKRYLNIVFEIIREGIDYEKNRILIQRNESLKNQSLAEQFNILGTQRNEVWIGAQKEHVRSGSGRREDIYFHLSDDEKTRIFFVEAKRLPMAGKDEEEEYVKSCPSENTKRSGGIERFKLGLHGCPGKIIENGMIGYVENKSVKKWVVKINTRIGNEYPNDEGLTLKNARINEFHSKHEYLPGNHGFFYMHHFWIDLTQP